MHRTDRGLLFLRICRINQSFPDDIRNDRGPGHDDTGYRLRQSGVTEDDCDDLANLAGQVAGSRVSITVRELRVSAGAGFIVALTGDILTMPGLLFCSLCCLAVMRPPLAEALALVALPQTFALFFAMLGLTLNLKRPNLRWTNELAPIKQSLPVTIVLFGSWALVVALAGIYFLLTPPFGAVVYLWIFTALMALASLGLYLWLRRRGGKIFMEL